MHELYKNVRTFPKKSPKIWGIEMCLKENKRNDKPSWVCFIVTVHSIKGRVAVVKLFPENFYF